MDIKELSIGDWVQLENTPFQVMGINPPYVDLIGNGNRLRMCDIDSDNLTLIAITPEILEKNGVALAEDYDEYSALYTCPQFSVIKYGDSYTFEVPQARVRVEYIHELQHAIRLAGIEKDIEV